MCEISRIKLVKNKCACFSYTSIFWGIQFILNFSSFRKVVVQVKNK